MKLVISRVLSASVSVEEQKVSQISAGLLVLVGIEKGDSIQDLELAATRLIHGRFFENDEGKPHYSALELKKPLLLVSQFTLCADLKTGGRRPDFTNAMNAREAKAQFEAFCQLVERSGLEVQCGVFGAYMKVESINDGPFTLLWSS